MGMTNEYYINMKVIPDVKQVKTDLQKISETTTFKINAKIDKTSYDKVSKTVETYVDNIGKKFQVTTLTNAKNGDVLSETLSKIDEKFKDVTNTSKNVNTQLDKTNETSKKVKTGLEETNKTIKKTNEELNKTGTSSKNASKNLKEVGDSTKKVGQNFTDIIKKVGKFYLATLPIQMVQKGITETIEVVKDFDSALTEFKKVSDLSGESLDNYTKKLGEMGSEVARTTTQMIEASTEFKKGGYSDEQSAQLAQIASLYQNIADEELTAGESASFIISQMKAFNVEASDAISIIDQVNEVSNNYAVSSTDLSLALTKTSSAMSALGNSSQETIGLVTAGTEIMTGQASKVARGLRTIGNNIANLAQKQDTLKITVKGMTKNISLLDEKTGDMKSTFAILKDVYTNGWNEMSNAEQQALAISLAGKLIFASIGLIAGKVFYNTSVLIMDA